MRLRSRVLGLFPLYLLASLPARGVPPFGRNDGTQVTPAAVRSASRAAHPQLGGSWLLNPAKSKERLSSGGGSRPGSGEDEGFPRMAFGGNRGLGELLRPKPKLTIVQNDSLITVADDAGWIRALIPTGQRMREELGQGGPAEVATRWKGDKLIAERFLELGGTYRESYEVNQKAGRLTLKVSFQTARMPRPVESSRVYERELGS